MAKTVKPVHNFYNGNKLTPLLRQLALMAGKVESLLSQTLNALKTRDINQAVHVSEHKDGLFTLHQNIHIEAEKLLSNYYFGAHDLRRIISTIKIASDIERIGDISANISLRLKTPSCMSALSAVPGITQLGKQVQQNLITSIDALIHENPSKAMQVYNAYDDIDRLRETLEGDVLMLMIAEKIDTVTGPDLISIIRYFGRLADRARNISEKVYYAHMLDHLQKQAPDDNELQSVKQDIDSFTQKRAV